MTLKTLEFHMPAHLDDELNQFARDAVERLLAKLRADLTGPKAKVTQEQIGKLLGVSQEQAGRLIKKRSGTTFKVALAAARNAGISDAEILDRIGFRPRHADDAALEHVLATGQWTELEARIARNHAMALEYPYSEGAWSAFLVSIRTIENMVRQLPQPALHLLPAAPSSASPAVAKHTDEAMVLLRAKAVEAKADEQADEEPVSRRVLTDPPNETAAPRPKRRQKRP